MKESRLSTFRIVILVCLLLIPVSLVFFDRPVMAWMRGLETSNSFLYLVYLRIVPFVKMSTYGTVLIPAAFVVYLIGKRAGQKIYLMGKALLIGIIGSGIAVQVIKHLVGRARPKYSVDGTLFIGPSIKNGFDSFPSGHSVSMFCIAFIVSHFYPRLSPFFYLFAFLTAFQRMETIHHFPSDILGGIVFGLLSARFVLLKTTGGMDGISNPGRSQSFLQE